MIIKKKALARKAMADDSGVLGNWKVAIYSTYRTVINWYDQRNDLIQAIIVLVTGGLIQYIASEFNISVNNFVSVIPPTNQSLLLVVLGLVAFQTGFYYLKLNRIESELRSMSASREVKTDGGTESLWPLFVASLGGALIGGVIIESLGYPQYQLVGAAVGAFVAIKIVENG